MRAWWVIVVAFVLFAPNTVRLKPDTTYFHLQAQPSTPADDPWNFDEEKEPVETWQHLVRTQAVDVGFFGAFAVLALTSFFRKSVTLKYVTLIAAVAYLG